MNPDEKGSDGVAVVPKFSARTSAAECVYGPNLPSHTYGLNTGAAASSWDFSVSLRGEYEGGHYMYDGAGFNAVQRSVRWPGCYDFYTLQETGKIDQATALQTGTVHAVVDAQRLLDLSGKLLQGAGRLGQRPDPDAPRQWSVVRASDAVGAQRLEVGEQGLPRLRSGDGKQWRIRFEGAVDSRARATTGALHGVAARDVLSE